MASRLPLQRPKGSLGQYIVKVCPYDGVEFKTDKKQAVYCSRQHQILDKQRRHRARKYAEREIVVSDKPGASYRLNVREFVAEPPPKLTVQTAPKPVVVRYQKIPVRSMSNFQSTFGVNMPVVTDSDVCVHGYLRDCPRCWLT